MHEKLVTHTHYDREAGFEILSKFNSSNDSNNVFLIKRCTQYFVLKVGSLTQQSESFISDEAKAMVVNCGPEFIGVCGFSERAKTVKDNPWLLMDFVPCGNLQSGLDAMRDKGLHFPDLTKFKLSYGIASALMKLHGEAFVHCDLKPSHVLIDYFLCPHVAHLSYLMNNGGECELDKYNGTHCYSPPETFQGKVITYTDKYDVYSYGGTLFSILTNDWPFSDQKPEDVKEIIMNGERDKRFDGKFEGINAAFYEIVKLCWKTDPNERPTMRQITEWIYAGAEKLKEKSEEDYKQFIQYAHSLNSKEPIVCGDAMLVEKVINNGFGEIVSSLKNFKSKHSIVSDPANFLASVRE